MEKRTKIDPQIETMKLSIENAIGFKAVTPKHFDTIRKMIFNRTGEYVSSTTLKRIWGYLDEPIKTRTTTLSIIVRALGFLDWEDFISRNEVNLKEKAIPSSPKFGKSINVLSDLKPGDELQITWYPERVCLIRYLGDMEFEVLDSINTRLKKGNRFKCHLIIAGHPLYLSLTEGTGRQKTMTYVCGKLHGGIQFEIVHPDESK